LSYLLSGYSVDFVHFATDIDKVANITNLRNTLNKESKIYVVSFSPVQEKIVLSSEESYRTLMYKVC
jgi:adenylyl- and sulfurtransferase ThiI